MDMKEIPNYQEVSNPQCGTTTTHKKDNTPGMMSDLKAELTADVIVEFLEVAIHQILYLRNVYPKLIFAKRKKYHVPVYQSVHHGVNDYIKKVLLSVKSLLEQKVIEKVIVNIKYEGKPIEKFVFEISHQDVTAMDKDPFLVDLEHSLRGVLLKLTTCDSCLAAAPDRCSFEVQIGVASHSALGLMYDDACELKWSRVQPPLSAEPRPPEKIVPLKSASASPFAQLQVYAVSQQPTGLG